MPIGYLGPAGSFSHEVALTLGDKDLIPLSSFELGRAMRDGTIERAVLPVENSIEGRVKWVLDFLAENGDKPSAIIGEVIWDIKHCLAGFGAITEVRTVCSHPQALGQCRAFLGRLKEIETRDVDSTSAAVMLIAEKKEKALAAIGTMRASEIYEVPVIQEDIGDHRNNQTRFIILGKERKSSTGNDKTSLVFGTEDKPGALHEALEVFKVLRINMTMIFSESSPRKRLGEYIFFVDVEGHQEDRSLSLALDLVKKKVSFLRILGSFPKAKR
jgi:prephenate dehydratase